MPKRREDPARPYYDIRGGYDASRKAYEDAANNLHSTVESLVQHMPETDPARAFLVEAAAKFRAAAYGAE